MINVDRDALICDLAETYHVFDFKSLPCKMVGILSCGLRDNSRIKMSLSGEELNLERALLAGIYDNTKILSWLNSSDGAEGINRPESIFKSLLKDEEDDSEILSFESKEEFWEAWNSIAGGEKDGAEPGQCLRTDHSNSEGDEGWAKKDTE